MAPYNCDMCEVTEATHQITAFEDGKTEFLCIGCLSRFGLALAVQVLEPAEILEAVGPLHVVKPDPKGRKGRVEPDPKSEDQAPENQDAKQGTAEGVEVEAPAANDS